MHWLFTQLHNDNAKSSKKQTHWSYNLQGQQYLVCGQEALDSLSMAYSTRTRSSTADQEAMVASDNFFALADSMLSWQYLGFSPWHGVAPVSELIERLVAISQPGIR